MRHCTESKMYNAAFFCYNKSNFALTEDYVKEVEVRLSENKRKIMRGKEKSEQRNK